MSRKRNKKVEFVSDKKDVDVVIPVYSNFPVVARCIQSLIDSTENVKFGITLVDDASPDYNPVGREFYDNLPPEIKVIRHMKNTGFPVTVNDGVAQGKSKYVLILNSDVLLQKNALDILHVQLEANADIGITAPKLLFWEESQDGSRPAGKVQHAGVVFDIQGNPYHLFNGWSSNHPFVNVVRDMDAVTGACILVRRSLWQEIGGFDPIYGLGCFEDLDLAFRIRMMGYKIRYLCQAVGYHYVGMSVEKHFKQDQQGFPLGRNANIFKARYGGNIPWDEWIFASN